MPWRCWYFKNEVQKTYPIENERDSSNGSQGTQLTCLGEHDHKIEYEKGMLSGMVVRNCEQASQMNVEGGMTMEKRLEHYGVFADVCVVCMR